MAGRIGQGGIVTNGLLFFVDASNPRSYDYPYTSTSWFNLINNSNWQLINGPLYNSSNGGSIVFDGINDFVSVGGSTFGYSPGSTGEITLECWVYPTGPYTSYLSEPPVTNLGGLMGQGYFAAARGWGLGVVVSSGINFFNWQVRDFGNVVAVSNVSFTNNSWYHLVGTFTRNELSRVYVNGVLRGSTSSTPLNGVSITPGDANASIGAARNVGGGVSFASGCRIGSAKLYNRPLSQQEVLQNFNATRTRFGI